MVRSAIYPSQETLSVDGPPVDSAAAVDGHPKPLRLDVVALIEKFQTPDWGVKMVLDFTALRFVVAAVVPAVTDGGSVSNVAVVTNFPTRVSPSARPK